MVGENIYKHDFNSEAEDKPWWRQIGSLFSGWGTPTYKRREPAWKSDPSLREPWENEPEPEKDYAAGKTGWWKRILDKLTGENAGQFERILGKLLSGLQGVFQGIGQIGKSEPDNAIPVGAVVLHDPSKYGTPNSAFQWRHKHPNKNVKESRMHEGTDYPAPLNTSLKATAVCQVVGIGHQKGLGKYAILLHGVTPEGHGIYTLDAHLNKVNVAVGTVLKPGQQYALTGNTGAYNTGPHLHRELWLPDRSGKYWYTSFEHGKNKNLADRAVCDSVIAHAKGQPTKAGRSAEKVAVDNLWRVDKLYRPGGSKCMITSPEQKSKKAGKSFHLPPKDIPAKYEDFLKKAVADYNKRNGTDIDVGEMSRLLDIESEFDAHAVGQPRTVDGKKGKAYGLAQFWVFDHEYSDQSVKNKYAKYGLNTISDLYDGYKSIKASIQKVGENTKTYGNSLFALVAYHRGEKVLFDACKSLGKGKKVSSMTPKEFVDYCKKNSTASGTLAYVKKILGDDAYNDLLSFEETPALKKDFNGARTEPNPEDGLAVMDDLLRRGSTFESAGTLHPEFSDASAGTGKEKRLETPKPTTVPFLSLVS
ncbi:MAG: peptidoglycan DD-metalloendopeptidase family protein [Alphaproteobacteria bacterium]|nr:peptidoglycan DD-metalloendopeptidase family protein [Alphaproteobacteria bacterium]